jgi:serine/threonine protein kinase/Flp pilus assembly protein TadD
MNLVHSNKQASTESSYQMPQAFKHYEIRVCLESNSRTSLYEAWDTVLHRLVTIKNLTNLGSEFETVLQQTRIAAAITHPALVKIHALEVQEGSICIVMELVKGKPLLQWMQENHGRENLALIHIKQAAIALQEAHAAGLIHGDLKPDNFVIDTDGKIRLINLGLATHYNPHVVNNVAEIDPHGSIAYLAPERFSEQNASAASDVFSLGTILYQMLTGQTPYSQLRGLSLVAAQAQTSSDQWTWPTSISTESRELILGMTDRDQTKRINCQQVQEKCQKLVVKEAASNSQNQLIMQDLQALVKEKTRQKRRRYGMILLVLLIASGIGIWKIKPNWTQITQNLKPYSESVELEQGMQALARYDKPGMLDAASQHFNRVLEHEASNAKALAGLSIVYSSRLRSNKRDDVWRGRALASAQQALKYDADLAITQIAYALALDPHRQFEQVMNALKKAKQLEPNNLLAWQTEMRTLLMARQFEVAIQTADTALKLFPHDWLISNLKGIVYINQAQYQKAEPIFRSIIERSPDVMLSYNYLAIVLDLQGRVEEALQILQQGLQVRQDGDLYSQLGIIKFKQADYPATVYAMERAIESNPQEYGSWLVLADALMQLPNKEKEATAAYSKARDLLSGRLALRPNDGWFTAYMALFEARLNEDEKAHATIKKAIDLSPNNPDVLFRAACVYELIGLRTQALEEIKKAKQLGFSESQILTEPILKELRKDVRY